MPYIKTVPPSEATGKLKEISIRRRPSAAKGKVSMIRQVQSLNPEALAAWRALTVVGGNYETTYPSSRRCIGVYLFDSRVGCGWTNCC